MGFLAAKAKWEIPSAVTHTSLSKWWEHTSSIKEGDTFFLVPTYIINSLNEIYIGNTQIGCT